MPTIIDQRPSDSSNSTLNTLIMAVLLMLLVFLFFYFGLPALRGVTRGPTINVPDEVDVNINQGQPDNGGNTTPSQ